MNDFEGLPECPPGPNRPPSMPEVPQINYYMALLEGLFHSYQNAANMCQAHTDFERSMYYRGKADATREAMAHYRELRP